MRRFYTSDRRPLITDGRGRAISHNSLDPNEDPVSGLERVSSALNIQNAQRRLYRERTRRLQEQGEGSRVIPSSATAHTLSEKFESLDYEIVENELYRAAESDKEHQATCRDMPLVNVPPVEQIPLL